MRTAHLAPRSVARCLNCPEVWTDGVRSIREVTYLARRHARTRGHRVQLERIHQTNYVGQK